MAGGNIHIGTSGWMYKQWNKFYYPKDVKGTKQLPYFARQFDTVEINSSFYRIPRESAAAGWFAATPASFGFAVKLNQYLTHRKRLILDETSRERLEWFTRAIAPLKKKAKVLLVQLPPRFHANFARLDEFLAELEKQLPWGLAVACEFRHDSWLTPELYKILRRHRAALVIPTFPGKFRDDFKQTADIIYIRYHATSEKPDYSEAELDKWAAYIKKLSAKNKAVYVYFNNDYEGWAIVNAQYLQRKLGL